MDLKNTWLVNFLLFPSSFMLFPCRGRHNNTQERWNSFNSEDTLKTNILSVESWEDGRNPPLNIDYKNK